MRTGESRWWRILPLVMALGLMAAACSDAGSGDEGETGTTGTSGSTALPGEGTEISIAVNPWTGSAVNANIAKILLEQQLGYTVSLVDIDEFAQFPALSTGELDATLEVWPSGHAEDYATYIEGDGSVVDGGELGVVGKIGWYVPTYLVDEHPEIATVEGLNEDAVAVRDGRDRRQGPDARRRPELRLLRQGDRGEPQPGLRGRGGRIGGRAALRARHGLPEQGAAALLLVHAALGEPDVRPHRGRAPRGDRGVHGGGVDEDGRRLRVRLPAGRPVQGVQRGPGVPRAGSVRLPVGDELRQRAQEEVAFAIDEEKQSPEEAAQAWVDANQDVWQPWVDAASA